MRRHDAIVIGGGPAGATAALLLARAGWTVAVIEKTRFPRRKVCGEYVSAAVLPVLRELGLDAAFAAAAGPEVKRVGLYAGEVAASADMPACGETPDRYGRALDRRVLDMLLLDRAAAAGAQVWQPCRAIGLRGTAGAYICDVEHRRSAHAIAGRCVIAAHGSWESGGLPTQATRAARSDSDLFGFKAHFRNARLAADLMPLVAFPGGYGGMVHTSDDRVSFSCCARRDMVAALRARCPGVQAGEAVMRHVLASNAGARAALRHAELDDAWLAAGPLRPGMRRSPLAGVYLIGNAAGEAHPVVAEGISMAIQSASLLCSALTARSAMPDTMRAWEEVRCEYERRWRGLFAPTLRSAACYAHLAMRPALASSLASLLAHAPGLLTFAAGLSGKLRTLPSGAC